jgi:hypothetical protein
MKLVAVKLVRTKEQFDKWADMWMNAFEFTSRAAAYAVAKAEYKARNIAKKMSEKDAEAAAIEQATAYAKNLANFEQIGEHGRLAGALFMFFRPAATGAVRALDSLSPAFQNTAAMIEKLPDAIKNDPKAVEAYRKEHQAKKKQAKHIMAVMAGSGALIYTMALVMAGEDDEGRNKVATDNMQQWTRYARLPIPGTDYLYPDSVGVRSGGVCCCRGASSRCCSGQNRVGRHGSEHCSDCYGLIYTHTRIAY